MNNLHTILYENDSHKRFEPLNRLMPAAMLRCGFFSFYQRLTLYTEAEQCSLCLPKNSNMTSLDNFNLFEEKYLDDDFAFINATTLIQPHLFEQLQSEKNTIWIHKNKILMARLDKSTAIKWMDEDFRNDFTFHPDIQRIQTGPYLMEYPWDLIHHNQKQMELDYQLLDFSAQADESPKNVFISGSHPVFFESPEFIEAGVVIDSNHGPVYLEKDVHIGAGSVLQGPLIMKKHSSTAINTALRPGCHIGEYSKVGGEISNSIIQGYSNKAHEGFLGTSYIGRWCNLGAGTNVSNLKNNYGTIHVWNQGEMIDSGLQFQGLIMGDHCKTAIGTRFNTGTVVDTAANIFCPDFPPKYIPAFNWGGDDPKLLYAIDKFLETASIVLKRKGLSLNDAEINALKSLHKNQEKY